MNALECMSCEAQYPPVRAAALSERKGKAIWLTEPEMARA